MCGTAVSLLGISVWEFYDMTPIELHYAFRHREERQKKEDEQKQEDYKTMFEGFRFLAIHLWEMQGKTLKKGKHADKKMVPLPWDEEEVQSLDEMKQKFYAIADHYNRKEEKKKTKKTDNKDK